MIRWLALLWLVLALPVSGAERFWVDDGACADDFVDTDCWSATSGGSGGASVPAAGDNATWDDNSSSQVVDVDQSSGASNPTMDDLDIGFGGAGITFRPTGSSANGVNIEVQNNLVFTAGGRLEADDTVSTGDGYEATIEVQCGGTGNCIDGPIEYDLFRLVVDVAADESLDFSQFGIGDYFRDLELVGDTTTLRTLTMLGDLDLAAKNNNLTTGLDLEQRVVLDLAGNQLFAATLDITGAGQSATSPVPAELRLSGGGAWVGAVVLGGTAPEEDGLIEVAAGYLRTTSVQFVDTETGYIDGTTGGRWVSEGTDPTGCSNSEHASAAGNDTTGDGTIGTPWRTFQKALDEAASSNECVLLNRGDTFTETTDIDFPNTSGLQIGMYGTGEAAQVLASTGVKLDLSSTTVSSIIVRQIDVRWGTLSSTPRVVARAMWKNCIAPCLVMFDARTTAHPDMGEDNTEGVDYAWKVLVDIVYDWDFGDLGSGNWTSGARADLTSNEHSKNYDTGPVAAHVFETAGTYTVSVIAHDLINSTQDTRTLAAITVIDPDTVHAWDGSGTTCIGNSLPAAGAGGCPAGADVAASTDFDVVWASEGCDAGNTRCLFETDDTFTSSATVTITSFTLIGSFGTGAKPIISILSGVNCIQFAGLLIQDVRIMDFNMNGGGTAEAAFIRTSGASSTEHWHNLFLRVNMDDMDIGVLTEGQTSIFDPDIKMHREYGVVDSTILDGTGNGNSLFMMGRHTAIMGNQIGDRLTDEHVLRCKYCDASVLSHNEFNPDGTGIGCGSIRHVMKMVAGLTGTYGRPGWSGGGTIVADNFSRNCTANSATMWTFGQTSATPAEGQWGWIVERNFVTNGTNLNFNSLISFDAASWSVARNNACFATGVQAGGWSCIRSSWRTGGSTHLFDPLENRIYNNAVYQDSATGSAVTAVTVGSPGDADLTRVCNNVIFSEQSGSVMLSDSGTGTVDCGNNQDLTVTSPYISATPSTYGDFRPADGGVLEDAGDAQPASRGLFTGVLGPVSTQDIGVFEVLGGTTVTSTITSTVLRSDLRGWGVGFKELRGPRLSPRWHKFRQDNFEGVHIGHWGTGGVVDLEGFCSTTSSDDSYASYMISETPTATIYGGDHHLVTRVVDDVTNDATCSDGTRDRWEFQTALGADDTEDDAPAILVNFIRDQGRQFHDCGANCTINTDTDPSTFGTWSWDIDATGGQEVYQFSTPWTRRAGGDAYMDGAYSVRFWVKLVSGTCTTAELDEGNGTVASPATFTPTGTWTQLTRTVTVAGSDPAIGLDDELDFQLQFNGCRVRIDDVEGFDDDQNDIEGDAVFSDSFIQVLRDVGVFNSGGALIRHLYQEGGLTVQQQVADQLDTRDFKARGTASGTITDGDHMPMGMHKVLEMIDREGGLPYWVLTGTAVEADIDYLMDYYCGTTGTTQGDEDRVTLGQTQPWCEVFPFSVFEYANEVEWNQRGEGTQSPGEGGDTNAGHWQIMTARAKAHTNYNSNMQFIGGTQTSSEGRTNRATQHAALDGVAITTYIPGSWILAADETLLDTAQEKSDWAFLNAEFMANGEGVNESTQMARNDQITGASKEVYVYEGNWSMTNAPTQAWADSIQCPKMGGISAASMFAKLVKTLGIRYQVFFNIGQISTIVDNGSDCLWGAGYLHSDNVLRLKPTGLAMSLVNDVFFGDLLTTTHDVDPTISQTASPQRSESGRVAVNMTMNAIDDYCTQKGETRACLIFNLDSQNSHNYISSFTGRGVLGGTATRRKLAGLCTADNNSDESSPLPVMINESTITWATGTQLTIDACSMESIVWIESLSGGFPGGGGVVMNEPETGGQYID